MDSSKIRNLESYSALADFAVLLDNLVDDIAEVKHPKHIKRRLERDHAKLNAAAHTLSKALAKENASCSD